MYSRCKTNKKPKPVEMVTPREVEEIRSWVPQQHQFGTWEHCTYCGCIADTRDHVIPFSMLYPQAVHSGSSPGLKCTSCRECNGLLSSFYFYPFAMRCQWITNRIKRRYNKFLRAPRWEKSEIKDLCGPLKSLVKARQVARNLCVEKTTWQNTQKFREIIEKSIEEVAQSYPNNKKLHEFLSLNWS